jgi:hypothetical protein
MRAADHLAPGADVTAGRQNEDRDTPGPYEKPEAIN